MANLYIFAWRECDISEAHVIIEGIDDPATLRAMCAVAGEALQMKATDVALAVTPEEKAHVMGQVNEARKGAAESLAKTACGH